MKVPTAGEKTADKAVGRTRGGLNTKLHTIVDGLGNPVTFLLSAGNDHDSTHAIQLLEQVNISGSSVLADRAYHPSSAQFAVASFHSKRPLRCGQNPAISTGSSAVSQHDCAGCQRPCHVQLCDAFFEYPALYLCCSVGSLVLWVLELPAGLIAFGFALGSISGNGPKAAGRKTIHSQRQNCPACCGRGCGSLWDCMFCPAKYS